MEKKPVSGKHREIFGNKYFRDISRVFTEQLPKLVSKVKKSYFLNDWRIAMLSAAIIFLLSMVIIQAVDTIDSIKKKQENENKRTQLAKEVDYWQGIVKKYEGYRDGYLKLALLEYQFKNLDKSKFYLQKALVLDPNSETARKLEKILE